MIKEKKAMYCPGCKIIVCKQTGCDWLVCPMCKIEICWATLGWNFLNSFFLPKRDPLKCILRAVSIFGYSGFKFCLENVNLGD